MEFKDLVFVGLINGATQELWRMQECWVFCEDELNRPNTCHGDDEFMAASEIGILVQRNGGVTNRFADGIVGVPRELRELADAEETLYRPDDLEYADNWHTVEVAEDGAFICFVEDLSPRTLLN